MKLPFVGVGIAVALAGLAAAAVAGPASSASVPAAAATAGPPFTLRKDHESWSLCAPDGAPFFSLGVCSVNQGASRVEFDPENPSYAAWRHYSDAAAWADDTVRRLKEWRFTTVAAWSEHRTLRAAQEMTLWHTPVLHMGSSAGAPWWDMWDQRVVNRMEQIAREQILQVRDDPRLIGYYFDNELGWWNATLFKMTLEQSGSSGQRKRLMRLLRETYHDDWAQLLRDFEPEHADNWRQLEKSGMLFLKPGGDGIRVMRRFLALLADRYYQLCRDLIRKYDRRALLLGDRYQSFYYPEVVRAAAPYVDAISSNLNASWNDGTYLRCYLETLHALAGKPVLATEVYLAATENRSGNRNDMGIYPVVPTQAERAAAIDNTLRQLLQTPYVVGVDWFQYADEPRHGRQDGENYNFGLVDLENRPYAELTSAFAHLNVGALRSAPAAPRLDASHGVPSAPADPFADFRPTRALRQWDRERGFVPAASPLPMADLYLCWNEQALYLGVYGLDIIEDAFYRDRSVPKSDRPVWTVEVKGSGGKVVRVRLGGGREAIPSEPGLRVEHLSGLNLNVRNIAALELPAAFLNRSAFHVGDVVELSSSLVSHARAYRTEWRGRFVLGEAGREK
jgi:hypothetical protein